MAISHSYSLYDVKRVVTSPALLENASLLLVFGSRVTPSTTFDPGESFRKMPLHAARLRQK